MKSYIDEHLIIIGITETNYRFHLQNLYQFLIINIITIESFAIFVFQHPCSSQVCLTSVGVKLLEMPPKGKELITDHHHVTIQIDKKSVHEYIRRGPIQNVRCNNMSE